MCGLVFAIFPDNYKEHQDRRDIFTQLLYASALRGDDASGVFATNWDGSKEAFYKRAIPAHDFIHSSTYGKIMNNLGDYNILMGHTRKATYGLAPEDSGAHPFRKRHITLVHNGHINNAHSLPVTKDPLVDIDQTTVDSDLLCRSFADAGYKEALAKVSGAWAVIWYDEENHTLSLSRNNARPLFFGYIEELNMILGGSELPMLDWVLARNGYAFKETPLQVRDILDDKEKGEIAQVVTFREDNFPKYSSEDLIISAPKQAYSAYMRNQFGRDDDDDIARAAARAAATQERLRPTSKKENKRAMKVEAKDKLKAIGLEQGQIVDFMPGNWVPYNEKAAARGIDPTLLGRWYGIIKAPYVSHTGRVLVNFSCLMDAMKRDEIDDCKIHRVKVLSVGTDPLTDEWVVKVGGVLDTEKKIWCIYPSAHDNQYKAEKAKASNIGRILALYAQQQERNSAKKVPAQTEAPVVH